ncbi:MAG: DUF1127 domain-containing protein [Inquilinaceae bacterium]
MGAKAIETGCVRPGRAESRTVASLKALHGLFWTWRFRRRSRRALAQMDDRMMRDIGVTRLDVVREYRKPFWRP